MPQLARVGAGMWPIISTTASAAFADLATAAVALSYRMILSADMLGEQAHHPSVGLCLHVNNMARNALALRGMALDASPAPRQTSPQVAIAAVPPSIAVICKRAILIKVEPIIRLRKIDLVARQTMCFPATPSSGGRFDPRRRE